MLGTVGLVTIWGWIWYGWIFIKLKVSICHFRWILPLEWPSDDFFRPILTKKILNTLPKSIKIKCSKTPSKPNLDHPTPRYSDFSIWAYFNNPITPNLVQSSWKFGVWHVTSWLSQICHQIALKPPRREVTDFSKWHFSEICLAWISVCGQF